MLSLVAIILGFITLSSVDDDTVTEFQSRLHMFLNLVLLT
jgi:hypothetical protein